MTEENSYKVLVIKPEGQTSGRPRCIKVDNIKMHVEELRKQGVNRICLVQNRDLWQAFMDRIMSV